MPLWFIIGQLFMLAIDCMGMKTAEGTIIATIGEVTALTFGMREERMSSSSNGPWSQKNTTATTRVPITEAVILGEKSTSPSRWLAPRRW